MYPIDSDILIPCGLIASLSLICIGKYSAVSGIPLCRIPLAGSDCNTFLLMGA